MYLEKTLLILYYSLIYPHLIYGIEVWGSANISLIKRLLTLQKRALFINLNILKIHDIFKINISLFVYQCLHKLCLPQFYSWFPQTSQIHNYHTRSAADKNLYIPRVRTTYYGLKSIKFMGPKIWNDLPFSIKTIELYNSFQDKWKYHFMT